MSKANKDSERQDISREATETVERMSNGELEQRALKVIVMR